MKKITKRVSFLLAFVATALLGCQSPCGPARVEKSEKYLNLYNVENVHFWLENSNRIKGFTGTLIIEDSKAGRAQFIHNNASPVPSFSKILLSPETIKVFKNQYDKHTGEIKNPSYHLFEVDGTLYTPVKIEFLK